MRLPFPAPSRALRLPAVLASCAAACAALAGCSNPVPNRPDEASVAQAGAFALRAAASRGLDRHVDLSTEMAFLAQWVRAAGELAEPDRQRLVAANAVLERLTVAAGFEPSAPAAALRAAYPHLGRVTTLRALVSALEADARPAQLPRQPPVSGTAGAEAPALADGRFDSL